MTAPTFVDEIATTWTGGETVKTTAAFDVLAGDIVIATAIGSYETVSSLITNNGAALTWTQQEVAPNGEGAFCWVSMWTTVLAGARTGLTLTFTLNASNGNYGATVSIFRNSGGVGAHEYTVQFSPATPSLDITTTQADSAIVVINADFDAINGGTRTWRSGAGTLTETMYLFDSLAYTLYGGYHANAGAAGLKTVGMTVPATQKPTVVALEVLGTFVPADNTMKPAIAGTFDPQLVEKAWY